MAQQLHSINPRSAGTAKLRAFEAEAYELRSRIGYAWDRLTADKPFDAYDRERVLEDVDRALAIAFKLTDIFREMDSELRRAGDRDPARTKHQAA
jgi:hypothetical protein